MRLLMVPPTHYEVAYEINPWMSRTRPAAREVALEQWEGLRGVLEGELGAEILLAEPQPGVPDLVFTANAGLVEPPALHRPSTLNPQPARVFLSRFRHPERQAEEEVFRAWFDAHGFVVEELPEGGCFEGEGDALWVGDTLFTGYRWRTDVRAHRRLGEALGARVLPLELVDPHFYHLDTCFCPLDPETVVYYPPAFDEYGCKVIEAHVPRRIEVHPEEAARFACNAVVIGSDVALNTGCPRLEADLRSRGWEPHATPLDEFIKAGGSAKCLTLYLDWPDSRAGVG